MIDGLINKDLKRNYGAIEINKDKCEKCLCHECEEECKNCNGCNNGNMIVTKCEKNDYGWINPNE